VGVYIFFINERYPDHVLLVHAILGIRPPAWTGGARLGLPGSHGPV